MVELEWLPGSSSEWTSPDEIAFVRDVLELSPSRLNLHATCETFEVFTSGSTIAKRRRESRVEESRQRVAS